MRNALALLLTLALGHAQADAGHCRVFFQQHHAVAVQQVVAVQPLILYQAGADIQAEALAEKVARLVQQKLTLAQQAPQQQRVAPSAFAKCAACHTGENAAGGLVLDGQTLLDCQTYAAWGRMAGLGEGIPDKMRAVVGSLSPQEKGDINEAILRLLKPAAPVAQPGELQ